MPTQKLLATTGDSKNMLKAIDMSESTEMYLLTIYKLNQEFGKAGNTAMAKWLGVSTASITEMLKKLRKRNLVVRKGRGLFLTQEGHRIAMNVIRKHRLAECFLTDKLQISWEHAHEQACRLEHVLSDQVCDALEEFLQFPETCPHGHPIPDRKGLLKLKASPRLSSYDTGCLVLVDRVSEHSSEFLAHLNQLGIRPGVLIYVEKVNRQDHSILLKIEEDFFPIAEETANHIWATPVNDISKQACIKTLEATKLR